ncbi:uncharacterized protein LOC131321169 [Rhododendron vialii]|uniref:uncharacterized protein LOC131321169 n=1 Tax=Rhododendron vialii TaxID=182163 RepID=UPI00265E7A03|nr:uncharacterized protein LOC131321169 [Rhododendron vialii]
MAFLWSGTELKSSSAKIKWDFVCNPKEEGGLGFRRIKEWNKATMFRHLWALCRKADLFWVKWVHTYIIKGQCLWSMDIPSDASWTIRKVLGLKSIGQPLIQYKVGNGHDLVKVLSSILADLCILKCPISFVMGTGDGQGSGIGSLKLSYLRLPPLSSQFVEDDLVVWLPHPTGYSVHSAWEAIRNELPIQQWHKVVWFSRNVPHWAFILWLAIQNKLSTKDRLFKWGMTVAVDYVFYDNGEESHHHLFFQCLMSSAVLHAV